MTEKLGKGLLILHANGYYQVSVEAGIVYAGGKKLPRESSQQLGELGWFYDADFDSWIFDTLTE